MDLFACKSLLFLLVFIGRSLGQDILPKGPVDAIVGTTVTLKTLIDKSDFAFIIWNFNHAGEQTHIATQTTSDLKVNPPYEGRASMNKTNGYLTLGPLKLEDSGTYSINAMSPDGNTRTGEILLRVLGRSLGQDILPKGPVDAIVGTTVTLKTLIDKSDFAFIIWNFNHAGEQTHIATQTTSDLMLNTPYEGRVSIDKTNGYLTLGPLKLEDSGTYSINALSPDGTTRAGEILLRVLGRSLGQDILPKGPVDAIVGTTVTLKTLIDKSDFAFIIWNFNHAGEQTHIVTQTTSDLMLNTPYEGRVSIDKTNGYLTLGPLKLEDSGTYSINALSPDGTTRAGEILLRVLGRSLGQDILPKGPVDAIVGRTVTLKTLIDKSDFAFIIWNFNHAGEQTHIVTQTTSDLMLNTPYEGRVSIDKTNGYLTLGPLKLEDSGTYSINTLSPDGTTRAGEILLRVLGRSAGQDILPKGPVDAIVGTTVTLKTLIDKSDFAFIIWNFNHAGEQTHIATQTTSDLMLNTPYEGRVSMNKTNGYLTLGPLKLEDSGTYSINALSPDGNTRTGEILLRVLGCSLGQDILPKGPVDAIVGTTVTLKTLIDKSDFAFIIWNFNHAGEQTHIATQTTSDLKVNAPYEGRASMNKTNGYLTLGPLKSEDSGTYSINTLSPDGTTRTGEIQLRVLVICPPPEETSGL